MELKFRNRLSLLAVTDGSNRTFMELKSSIFTYVEIAETSSNRTFMELKLWSKRD